MNYLQNEKLIGDKIQELQFQTQVVEKIGLNSGIIVAPTGSGKTIISLRICLNYLKSPTTKIIYITPTVVLTQQQHKVFKSLFKEDLTGLLSASDKTRMNEYKKKNILFSTPHIIANEIKKGNLDLAEVSLIIFDEIHNIHDSYPYIDILDNYKGCKLIGMTASLGYKQVQIDKLKNLLKTELIIKVTPPRPDSQIKIIKLQQTSKIKEITNKLDQILSKYNGILQENVKSNDIYELRLKLLELIKIDFSAFKLLKIVNLIISIKHIIYLLTTQHISLVRKYLEQKIWNPKIPEIEDCKISILNLPVVEDQKIKHIIEILKQFDLNKSKGMIFTQYRMIADLIHSSLRKYSIKCGLLIGQKQGLKKTQQTAVIRSLNQNIINVLIATSVGEEGLDIPNLDFVIIYSPVQDPRRDIQRTGRTGRFKPGKIFYLIYENTADEKYYIFSKLNRSKFK